MTLTVNGQTRQVADGMMLSALLNELKLDPQRVAVELNRTIVTREQIERTSLNEGDALEIVQFVGGG